MGNWEAHKYSSWGPTAYVLIIQRSFLPFFFLELSDFFHVLANNYICNFLSLSQFKIIS